MDMTAVLSTLSGCHSPSGFEGPVRAEAERLLAPLVDRTERDALGNLFGIRDAAEAGRPTVMLTAHLDEIGLMVTGTEEGFLRFTTIGGVDPRILPALEVAVLTDPVRFGVITCLPPHTQTAEEMEKPFRIADLAIDAGLSPEEEIPVGTPVTFRGGAGPLLGGMYAGKAMDDRACFAMLLRTLEILEESPLPVNLIVAGSVQEEVGCRGAGPAAYHKAPDYAIAVDVTFGETADAPKHKTVRFGSVPISLGPNIGRHVSGRLKAVAEKEDIPWQPEVWEGHSGTDAWTMQVAGNGTAAGVVSLPLKYMHTAVEVVALDDLENGARLLAAFIQSFEGGAPEC
ncbi:M20/M25/M40 family metallo-hydrolase [Oscillospiraceae bacterium OttesenSCG-928-F05]|nr:M20/M25/M40 family metallo-hydrolase [Oscillospiraceae bacterium OttesenSCG-928-F05]